MNSQGLTKKRLPDAPGVYFFLGSSKRSEGGLGRNKKVLYIGRATSLCSRVKSYFAPDLAKKRSPWLGKMLAVARRVEYKKTSSVLEAILLEVDLIRKFKPPYNTELKDDKSFNCIVITDEEFPRVLLMRQNIIQQNSLSAHATKKSFAIKDIFGPFPDSAQLRIALKIIRKIFPFRDTCIPNSKPCFNRQLGLCPGVCTGDITAKEYQKHTTRLALFLSGKKAPVQKELEREMARAARAEAFERASELKRQLFALRHIHDVALIKNPPSTSRGVRVEAYDLSHFGGKGIVGAMAVVENGIAKPSEYRLFNIRGTATQNEVAGLQEILARRLAHSEWPMPRLIVVDGNAVQKRAAEHALAPFAISIPVVAVVKDERHRPREILGNIRYGSAEERAVLLANSEAHRFALRFQKQKRYTVG